MFELTAHACVHFFSLKQIRFAHVTSMQPLLYTWELRINPVYATIFRTASYGNSKMQVKALSCKSYFSSNHCSLVTGQSQDAEKSKDTWVQTYVTDSKFYKKIKITFSTHAVCFHSGKQTACTQILPSKETIWKKIKVYAWGKYHSGKVDSNRSNLNTLTTIWKGRFQVE